MLINPYRFASGGDPYWSNVVSLLHFDGSDGSTTFTDEKGLTWTNSGAPTISTLQSKFGGASGKFNGGTDALSIAASAAFNLTSTFTVEFFLRIPTTTALRSVFSVYTPGVGGMYLYLTATGAISFYISGGGATSQPLLVDAWVHIAVVGSGSVTKLYVGGVLDGTVNAGAGFSSPYLRIGQDANTAGNSFIGNMDEFRITKGVARYTANFVPPSAPLPNA